MAPTFDDTLEGFVTALIDRRFFSLGRICQRTGVSRAEVPGYLDEMVARGRLSPEERADALQSLADWRQWSRRNALLIIPLGLVFLAYEAVEDVHHGQALAIAGPLSAGIAGAVGVQMRYRRKRASRVSGSNGSARPS